jgi:hypothetical protein
MAARRPKHIKNGPDIFISHSNRDEKLAAALIKVCESVFPSAEIRCSSVSGYRFKSGDYRQQLRQEVDQSKTFIALLTPASI